MTNPSGHKWEFRARFRRHAFGWKSQPAIKRVKEAVSEIKKVAREDTMLAADKTIGQVVQALEISEQTFHRWRNQYGGMKAKEAKRLKELEQENTKLKRMYADLALENRAMKDLIEKKL